MEDRQNLSATKRWSRVSSALDPRTGRATSKPRRITSWTGVRIGGLSVTADGKYLALLKGPSESEVYVGELEANGTRLMNPRRLTLDERDDEPSAWTLDGKAVLFDSNQNVRSTFSGRHWTNALPKL